LCFGMLTMKPQIGLLVPICLLASGRYAAIAWSAVFAGLVTALPVLFFGHEVWTLFFRHTTPLMVSILEAPYPHSYQSAGVSGFLMARSLGADLPLAYGVQFAIALPVVVAVWILWRKPSHDPLLRASATAVMGVLVTPYGYTYELLALPLAALLLVRPVATASALIIGLLCLVWVWPRLSYFVSIHFMQATPLVVGAVAAVCLRRLLGSKDAPLAAVKGSPAAKAAATPG
jgi:hypothetical protein